jgi:class 3 adenylate cyclase
MTGRDLPETRYAQSGDVSIAYQVMGDGPIDFVLIPGLISNIETFHEIPGYTAFLRRLSASARVITFDKRGQGLSDRVAGAPSLEQRMDDVRAVMDAAGSRRAVLAGMSEGGAMSTLFAATYPDRVSHLVLFGSSPKFPSPPPEVADRMMADLLNNWGSGAMIKSARSPNQPVSADMMALFGRVERSASSPGTLRSIILLNRGIDVTPILGAIRVPTIVMHRPGDARVPAAGGRSMASLIPGAKYVEYAGDAHLPWVGDNAEEIIGDIREFTTGQRQSVTDDVDRVLTTVMFTDISGSTEKAVELGDQRWRSLLDEHDRLGRQIIDQHRGLLVKTTGDGVLATFDGPARAVRCALAFAAAARDIGVPLRAALHTGEVELRGNDIGGIAVHTAARVLSHSQSGEVLVSRVVTDLVAGAGLRFAERGSHELKGLPGRFELYAAGA